MAIDNCVSSNYLRRACLDSSSVDGGGNVNKSNLCASINEAGCEFSFDDVSISGPLSVGGIATFSGAAFFEDNFNSSGVSTLGNTYISDDLHVSGSSFFNNVTATGSSTFYDLTVTNETLLNNGTFTGDIKINNLTVTGTQYIEHRKNLYIGDPLITLNSGVAGANTYDIGWIGERGSSINVGTIWDESDDEFALVTTTDDGSSESVTISAYEKLKLGSIEATGKVGIGTATPDYALDVAGDAGFDEYLYHNGDNDTYIRFADNLVNMVAGGWSAIKLDTSTNKIQLNNSNADLDVQAMASDGEVILHTDAATNKVGIGTVTPSFSLHIQETGLENYASSSATAPRPSGVFSFYDHNNETAGLALQSFYDRATASDWYLGNAGSQEAAGSAPAYSGPLVFGNRTDATAYSEKMRINGDGKVGIGTTDPIGDLSVSGSTYSEKVFHTGSDGSWLQVGTGEPIILGDLSVSLDSAGVPSLSYDNSNGVFTYTPPNTGSMASKTATNYVLGSATGSLASQTANITDYVLKSTTGSMASKTATNYVLGSATGCAASKTCEYFTGQLFGYQTGASQTLSNGDSPVWNAGTSSWSYGPGGGGAGIALDDLSADVAAAGIPNLSYNNSNGTFTYTPPDTGSLASQTANITDYVLKSATGSLASQTADIADYVLGSATGSLASQTADIADYVLKTATGSLAAQTANISDYVLGSATGCAASKTCEYFTGKVFNYGLKAGESFSDGDTPVWQSSSSSWQLVGNAAGGTPPGGSDTEIQFNNGGSFGGSSYFTVDSTTGFLTARKAEVGAWPLATDYAFFGHTALDHHTDHNYALLQASDGTTFLSASTDKCLRFREGVTDVAMISGGAMRIGNGGLPSGTAGSLVVDNDVIAFYTSDERLKDNVAPIASGLNKISHLTGVQFDWNKDSYAHLQGHDIGVIAQNIETVLPEAVSTRPDGYKAVRYDKIVPVLIEGMKEQQIQIQNLQTEVDNLKYWLESV